MPDTLLSSPILEKLGTVVSRKSETTTNEIVCASVKSEGKGVRLGQGLKGYACVRWTHRMEGPCSKRPSAILTFAQMVTALMIARRLYSHSLL
jgi:hypothetical protein